VIHFHRGYRVETWESKISRVKRRSSRSTLGCCSRGFCDVWRRHWGLWLLIQTDVVVLFVLPRRYLRTLSDRSWKA